MCWALEIQPLTYLLSLGATAMLVGALEVPGLHSFLNFLGITQEGTFSRQGIGMLALPFFDGSEVAESFLGICSG